jgi:hypothetical protein
LVRIIEFYIAISIIAETPKSKEINYDRKRSGRKWIENKIKIIKVLFAGGVLCEAIEPGFPAILYS